MCQDNHICNCKQKQNKLYEDLLEIVEPRMITDFTGYNEDSNSFDIVLAVKEIFESYENSIKFYKRIVDEKLRLISYLHLIRSEELNELSVDFDEYESEKGSTDFSNIITLVEEALKEIPSEDCRISYDGK